ncbi:uncharacterized protein LOC131604757 [Vicia villosa]|uniref:uncharacterized protein LOC131604757 n=1 Tax=Vicia villosa TaxID=3911 RepID=UPI00273BD456|nr:uncharacterized protein LOC131604757 [Vicia villosa]
MGKWVDNKWIWSFSDWIVDTHSEASEELHVLKQILYYVQPRINVQDSFIWPLNEHGVFKVSVYYKRLMQGRGARVEDPLCLEAINILWKLWMPSKVKIFGWRLFQDRLALKAQLIKRGIMVPKEVNFCVFGCSQMEDIQHLFLNCEFVISLWKSIYVWLDIEPLLATDCISHFLHLLDSLRRRCSRKRVGCIWMATCWRIWKQRNDIIFNNAVADLDEIVHSVKMLSWWWLVIENKQKVLCNFYEWHHCPVDYM